MSDIKITCENINLERERPIGEQCHDFENRLVYAPWSSSGIEARCAYEFCAEKNDFRREAWFGWEPWTRDCSVFPSEAAREKCLKVLKEEPLKENVIEVAKMLGRIAAISALVLLGFDVALGTYRAGVAAALCSSDPAGKSIERDYFQ
mgnify:CR=1 FL=1